MNEYVSDSRTAERFDEGADSILAVEVSLISC